VNPLARCEASGTGAGRRWSIWIDESAEPAKESDDVLLASFSTGADFAFRTP
jgi:hypothetical protein